MFESFIYLCFDEVMGGSTSVSQAPNITPFSIYNKGLYYPTNIEV